MSILSKCFSFASRFERPLREHAARKPQNTLTILPPVAHNNDDLTCWKVRMMKTLMNPIRLMVLIRDSDYAVGLKKPGSSIPFSRPLSSALGWRSLVAVCAAVAGLIVGTTSQASNVLVNPSFEANSGFPVIPSGWTRFAPPTGHADYAVEAKVPPHSGALYFKEWSSLGGG